MGHTEGDQLRRDPLELAQPLGDGVRYTMAQSAFHSSNMHPSIKVRDAYRSSDSLERSERRDAARSSGVVGGAGRSYQTVLPSTQQQSKLAKPSFSPNIFR